MANSVPSGENARALTPKVVLGSVLRSFPSATFQSRTSRSQVTGRREQGVIR